MFTKIRENRFWGVSIKIKTMNEAFKEGFKDFSHIDSTRFRAFLFSIVMKFFFYLLFTAFDQAS